MHHSFSKSESRYARTTARLVVYKRRIAPFVIATVANHFIAIFGLFCSAHFLNSLGASFEIAGRFSNLFLHFLKLLNIYGPKKSLSFPSGLAA